MLDIIHQMKESFMKGSLTSVKDRRLKTYRDSGKQLRKSLREKNRHFKKKTITLLPFHEQAYTSVPWSSDMKDSMQQSDTSWEGHRPNEHVASRSKPSNHPSLSKAKDPLGRTH